MNNIIQMIDESRAFDQYEGKSQYNAYQIS